MLALGAYFGGNEKNIFVYRPAQGGGAGLVRLQKNCARTPITYRPAQGGGAGLLRLQNKTAPEPLAAPELLVLQNKTAPEPPLPYFGGSTSKKTAPEPPLPILLGQSPAGKRRDAQSTEKSVFYGLLSLVSVYGQRNYLWPNLWISSYSVRPPPIALPRSHRRLRRVNVVGYYPKSQNSDWATLRILATIY